MESIPFDESTIFQSRVTVAVLNVSGILDAVNVQINGAAANLALDKTAQSFEVPVIGTITLQEAS